jgi:hypothetical protein
VGWWSRLVGRGIGGANVERAVLVRLTLPGWSESAPDKDMRIWHDPDGDALSLAFLEKGLGFPRGSDETVLRRWCRGVAESRQGGLIQARAVACEIGPSVGYIYKRMQVQHTGYAYTGTLMTYLESRSLIWTIVAVERGTSGLREALVTADLMQTGKLTLEDYKQHWAQDPYEPGYKGVDRMILRFMSDDEVYDPQFPQHALSKVRRVMSTLPDHVRFDPQLGA